jgi:peptidylprolyl isomerase
MKKFSSIKYFFAFFILTVLVAFVGVRKRSQDGLINKDNLYIIQTKYGEMTLVLYDQTPKHRDNFKKLVANSTYDGTLFHRVIDGFMIQGGDPTSKNKQSKKPIGTRDIGYTIPAEFNSKFIHKKGALAAARQGDRINPEKRSSGSQFYIVQGKPSDEKTLTTINERKNNTRKRVISNEYLSNPANSKFKFHYTQILKSGNQDSIDYYNKTLINKTNELFKGKELNYTPKQIKTYKKIGGTPMLDMDYTVFGEVIKGLNIIDSIAKVRKGRGDRPIDDIQMTIKKL